MMRTHFIQTKEDLEQYITLTKEEQRWFEHVKGDSLPLRITHYYASLIDKADVNDPIRRQVVPTIFETQFTPTESNDPLSEINHSPFPRLIHRYDNRVALLVSDFCATYCRHCFRRRFTAKQDAIVTDDELIHICEYLSTHTQIKEMLLTGGDPLMVNNNRLEHIIGKIRESRSDLVLRLCTRIPATFPQRVSIDLITMLKKFSSAPVVVMTQFNHVREITAESKRAVSLFVENGFPLFNQTVLLQGVNDNIETLVSLMNTLVSIKVKPYYLFQGDMVEGTSHVRLPLDRAIEIEEQLRKNLSGLAMPVVAVDLPNGGGKVPLSSSYYLGKVGAKTHRFRAFDNRIIEYVDP
jgi:lysine 2,3-aminomutase